MTATTRLPHLALLLTLSLLPTPSLAQTPNVPAAPSKDTVLFDFEGGNFDGGTLSGDCWDKQPATPKTFVGRQGNSVVSRVHPTVVK